MIIHITRHGQPAMRGLPPGTDHEYPPGDPVLSVLGRRQAAWLGERLAALGFRGTIYSSPYRRTLETAQVIAECTDSVVFPDATLQEYVPNPGVPDFQPLSKGEMRGLYPCVNPAVTLCRPWFVSGPEGREEVRQRLRPFLDRLLATQARQTLLVGHGATVHGLVSLLVPDHDQSGERGSAMNWNCSLTTIDVGDEGVRRTRDFDVSHLPPDGGTSNQQYRDEA